MHALIYLSMVSGITIIAVFLGICWHFQFPAKLCKLERLRFQRILNDSVNFVTDLVSALSRQFCVGWEPRTASSTTVTVILSSPISSMLEDCKKGCTRYCASYSKLPQSTGPQSRRSSLRSISRLVRTVDTNTNCASKKVVKRLLITATARCSSQVSGLSSSERTGPPDGFPARVARHGRAGAG